MPANRNMHWASKPVTAPLRTDVKLPLTNNESERSLRGKVVKRNISLFAQTWEGAWARDPYLSLKQILHKNEVSFLFLFLTGYAQPHTFHNF